MDASTDPDNFDVESISSSTTDEDTPSLNGIPVIPLAGMNTKAELPSAGMVCDVKNLWEGEQKCQCCVNWVEEYPVDIQPNPEETEAVQQFALLTHNRKNHVADGKAMVLSSIVVQSPLLKPLLEKVFDGYAGITATLKKVTFSEPFEPFFYRWSEFKNAVEEVEDESTRAHAQLLYDVLFKELNETISTVQDLLSHGVTTYEYLWTLFKPGDLLFCQWKGEEMLMKLHSSEVPPDFFRLNAKYIDYNGFTFGYASHNFIIEPFEGTKAITDLVAYPIQFHSEAAAIQSRLAIRGKKFEGLQGYHYKRYSGFADLVPASFGRRRIYARNRIVSIPNCDVLNT